MNSALIPDVPAVPDIAPLPDAPGSPADIPSDAYDPHHPDSHLVFPLTPFYDPVIECILHIRDFRADYNWNARYALRAKRVTPSPDTVMEDEDNPGIEGLGASMEMTGQHTPVVVRMSPGMTKGSDFNRPELLLVEGFRRREAVAHLFRKGRG